MKDSNLSELINKLDNCSHKTNYYKILSSSEIKMSNLSSYLNFLENTYLRNLIQRTAGYELIAICWMQGAKTSIHDHNLSNCWVKIIEGSLREELFDKQDYNKQLKDKTTKKDDLMYIDNSLALHRLSCITKRAISLHLYTPPIDWCYQYSSSEYKKKVSLDYYN